MMRHEQEIEPLRERLTAEMAKILRVHRVPELVVADFEHRGTVALSGLTWTSSNQVSLGWNMLYGQLHAYEVALCLVPPLIVTGPAGSGAW